MDPKFALRQYFGPAFDAQTYYNLLYHLVIFIASTLTFVALFWGINLQAELRLAWILYLIPMVIFSGWWLFLALECKITNGLLHCPLPRLFKNQSFSLNFWQKAHERLKNPLTWRGLVYLVIKFPLSVISFCISIGMVGIGFGLLLTPVYYKASSVLIWSPLDGNWHLIDQPLEAWIAFFFGLLLAPLALRLSNAFARFALTFARLMLKRR